MSDVPDMDYNISQDFTAAYKVSRQLVQNDLKLTLVFSRSLEIYHSQKDANDRREARTHTRDRRSVYPRALFSIHFLRPPLFSNFACACACACRSCLRRTRPPRRSLIAARRRRTIWIPSFRASPASHPPLSVWSYSATAETSDMNSKRKAPKSQVRFSLVYTHHITSD